MNGFLRGRAWLPLLVYPAVSGIVLGAAFPPLPLGVLAYVGLIPLFLSVEQLRGRAAFGAGFVQGLVFYGATIYWISWITPPGAAGAIFYMSVSRGLFAWLMSLLRGRLGTLGLWCAPFLWVGLEYVTSLGDMGFPWVLLGLTQTGVLPLIQYAEMTGIYGVSFWAVLMNLAVLALVRAPRGGRRAACAAAVGILLVVPAIHGLWTMARAPADRTVRVGVVQPDMAPVAKEYRGFDYNFSVLEPLTVEAALKGAELVVWPETAVGYLEGEYYRLQREQVQALVDSLNVYLYTGAYRSERGPPARTYNSSFLFAPGESIVGHYDKTRLVPFGERTPFPELLPFLRKIRFSGGGFVAGNWDAGKDLTVFGGPGARFSSLICFDSVFPGLVRKFVLSGAEFLVVITNDGWFGHTSGPYQHAESAVFRAIENRRSVVRCANTGVSALIDPFGRKVQSTGIFHQAVLTGEMPAQGQTTLYTRYGDWFAQVCTGVSILLLVLATQLRAGAAEAPAAEAAQATPGEVAREAGEAGGGTIAAMPFLDHLEELRWRILKGLAAVAVGAVVCGIFTDEILRLLTRPALDLVPPPELIFLKPMGMFLVKLEIVLVGGAVLALPVLLYQIWLFVAPGLFSHERRYVSFIILSSTACFVVGALVAYLGVVPLALAFLAGMSEGTGVTPQYDIGFYISFVLRLLVAFGVVFELPVASFFLAKVGVLTSSLMRRGRRYAIVLSFVLAALLTPPDPISQLLMAVPLIVLYEVSIWVARAVNE